MMIRKRLLLTINLLILSIIIAACSTNQTQPTIQEPEILNLSYHDQATKLNQSIEIVLDEFNLSLDNNLIKSASRAEEESIDNYHFDWEYNYYKLGVPLFGTEGRLLSEFKDELIAKFSDQFKNIEVQWKETEEDLTLIIDFYLNAEEAELKMHVQELELTQAKPAAKLAIIIDDFGFNRRGTEEILAIDCPLTMALLPFRPKFKEDAELIRESRHELILHQPLEPTNPNVNPGKGAIYTDMTAGEIRSTLEENLSALTNIAGINHHMGSKASADKRVMAEIMHVLKERELFYIDSSTANKSVAAETAIEYGVATVTNYLFIDNIDDKDKVKEMIIRLAKIALDKKELAIIGHVRPNTAAAIKEAIPEIEEMGVKLVYASQIVN